MNRSIWKFPILVADEFIIDMPSGARLLDVQVQAEEPMLWAVVDPKAPVVQRKFSLRGTGHDASDLSAMPHVGTFQLRGGGLVFHLFDGGES
jgi:hypothetical protein